MKSQIKYLNNHCMQLAKKSVKTIKVTICNNKSYNSFIQTIALLVITLNNIATPPNELNEWHCRSRLRRSGCFVVTICWYYWIPVWLHLTAIFSIDYIDAKAEVSKSSSGWTYPWSFEVLLWCALVRVCVLNFFESGALYGRLSFQFMTGWTFCNYVC